MTKQKATENNILELTRNMIHLFLNKQTDSFLERLSDDFVWIGDYSNLYTRGKDAFIAAVAEKSELPPVTITEEEYSVLTHCGKLWISYGRCAVSSEIPDMPPLSTKFHFNFVWKFENDIPVLIEAMACHTQDPADQEESVSQSKVFKETLRYRQTIRDNIMASVKKLAVKEWRKPETHYLMPSEILYIKAYNKRSIVRTVDKTIITGIPIGKFDGTELLKDFIRVHKSYLVNSSYVDKVRRNAVTLTDGTELPVSRNVYKDVKSALNIE